jgi:di/tricarboxylate transporter
MLPLYRRRSPGPLGATKLEFGDTLLVQASAGALDELRRDPDFIVAEESPVVRFRPTTAVLAIAIVAGVVVVAALGVVPLLVAALGGAVLMAVLGIVKGEEMWSTIQWDVVFLLAGLIPLGIAFEKTGLASAIGSALASSMGGLPDVGIILVFYLVSALLTEVISNFANVVLLVPVAVLTAAGLAVSPVPLVLAVMFAASTSFMTPIGYQTNLMVYGPGGYRFTDFTRVGAPLNLILAIVASLAISVFFPLRP